MADVLTTESKRWLTPVVSKLTEQPRIVNLFGEEVLQTRRVLTTGEEAVAYIIERDGRGLPQLIFKPRVGTLPIGRNPIEPLKSPRASTATRAGSGAVVLIEGFSVVGQFIAEVYKNMREQEMLAEPRNRAEEDLDMSADLMASAQAAATFARQLIGTEKKLARKKKNPPRTKIHGYSRVNE